MGEYFARRMPSCNKQGWKIRKNDTRGQDEGMKVTPGVQDRE